jgi:hypothetical protein
MIDKLLDLVGTECSIIYIPPNENDDILIETGFEKTENVYLIRRKK